MKSQVSALLHVMQGLFTDVRASYPALKGLDLDFERLSLYCRTRGLTLFTLDLPNLDSLLLRGLESGRLELDGPLCSAVSKSTRVPRLFAGLWLRVFDRGACLKQDVDATAVFFLRQLCCLGKKIQVDCSPNRVKTTLENYHGIERTLWPPSLAWGSDELGLDTNARDLSLGDAAFSCHSFAPLFLDKANRENRQAAEEKFKEEWQRRAILNKVQRVADLILGSFDPYDPIVLSELLESEGRGTGFRHGPGAVSERLASDDKSDFPNWPDKLHNLFPFEQVGKTAGSDKNRPQNHEVPSRLICVPKTAKSPRLIAAEPTAHQYCQQQMRWFISHQLKELFGTSFIDFQDQSKSGDLVLLASSDRKLATVDLSDASDRLSCWTVERVFRSNQTLLRGLHAARTRYLLDNVQGDMNYLNLRKFASQGTATTFPVQSIVFLCIALACSLQGRVSWSNIAKLRNQVRVFGDDIIIPSTGYERLLRVMDSLQLKVNVAKSYVNGHFRESCGVDGFNGHDVTPVKPRTLVVDSPASCQAVVDTSNNLFNKGLWYASDSLRTLIPARIQRGIRIVGKGDAGFAGLTSYSGSDESHLRKRWNSRLHRYDVRVWTLCVKTRTRERQGFHCMLDFVSGIHNHEYPRIVSECREPWKTRDGFLWEPLNTDARTHAKVEIRT